jgi:uncharacterized protein YciI
MKMILTAILLFFLSALILAQNEYQMKFGDSTYTMKKYFFCLLKRGLNKNIDSLQLAKIQEEHLAHIFKMGKDGKVAIAGPFEGDGDLRGILIFTVNTKEEAEKLVSEDPAVKIGRLVYEIIPWWTTKGAKLP